MPARKTTTPPELLSLIEAAKLAPDDEAPRLVLADWLEEHGDEHDRARAEAVRLGVERRGLSVADEERRAAINARYSELARRHLSAWLAGLPPLDGTASAEGGFVTLATTVRTFLSKKLAGADPAAWAWVEAVEVVGDKFPPDKAEAFANCPLLAGPTSLDLSQVRLRDGDSLTA